MRRLLLTIAAAGVALAVPGLWFWFALPAADATTEVVASFDLTSGSGGGAERFFLVFLGYGGSTTGHLDVRWGMESPALRESRNDECFGFFSPQSWIQFTFRPIDGRLRACTSAEHRTHRVIVEVDEAAFKRTTAVLDRWRTETETGLIRYQLLRSDCVSFGADIARAAGLRVPERGVMRPRSALPQRFLETVIELNRAE